VFKELFNIIRRKQFGLDPAYTWAVENFQVMAKEIPGFEEIYAGLEPQKYIVIDQTKTHVRIELAPGQWEWHSKLCYIIVPGIPDHIFQLNQKRSSNEKKNLNA